MQTQIAILEHKALLEPAKVLRQKYFWKRSEFFLALAGACGIESNHFYSANREMGALIVMEFSL